MKNRTSPARRQVRGMSLIEILCAVLIMTVGIVGLVSLMARASQASISSDDAQRAALLADEMANTMWVTGQINQPAATKNAWNTRVGTPTAGGLPSGQGDIKVVNEVATITISWQGPGDETSRRRQYVTQVRLN